MRLHHGRGRPCVCIQEPLAFSNEAALVERTARLIGVESLAERERFLLLAAALFEEGYLRQSAFDANDT
jgi:vacuolar-type H+-ATPase catalytic subunit A/Vma1